MIAQGSPLTLIAHLSLEGGVVVLAILLMRAVLGRRLPPRWRCILWLLLGARLLLPVSFESRFSLFNLPGLHAISPPAMPDQKEVYSADVDPQGLATEAPEVVLAPSFAEKSTRSAGAPARPWYAAPWVWDAIWFAGFAGVVGLLLIRSVRWAARVASSSPIADARLDEVARECAQRLGLSRPPPIHENRFVTSPVLCGMLHPRILLPPRFTGSYEWEDIRFVLMHEMAHLKRHDLILAWILVALQAVHWFNPLVWLGFSRWRADRELACDATVLAAVGGGQNRRYGAAILRLAEKSGRPVAVPCSAGVLAAPADLHLRLRMVMAFEPAPRWSWLATVMVAALGLVLLSDANTRMMLPPAPLPVIEPAPALETWVPPAAATLPIDPAASRHTALLIAPTPIPPVAVEPPRPAVPQTFSLLSTISLPPGIAAAPAPPKANLFQERTAVISPFAPTEVETDFGVDPTTGQAHFRATSLANEVGLTPVQAKRVEGLLAGEIATRNRMGSTASPADAAAVREHAYGQIRQVLSPIQRLAFNLIPQALGGRLVGATPESRLELLDRLVHLGNGQKAAALTVYIEETNLVMEHRGPGQAAMVRKFRTASLRQIRNLLTPEQRLVWDRAPATKGGGVPNVSAKKQVDKLDDVAHLTGEQRRGVLRIYEETIAAWENLPWEERSARLHDYRKAMGIQICAMLTPAQQRLVNGAGYFGYPVN